MGKLEAALGAASSEVVSQALKLVQKIVAQPEEAKYRRLKASSRVFQERFGSASGRAVLEALGFEWEEEEEARVVLAEWRVESLNGAVRAMRARLEGAAPAAGESEREFAERRVREKFGELVAGGMEANRAAAEALAVAESEAKAAKASVVTEEEEAAQPMKFVRMETPEAVAECDMEAIEVLYRAEGLVFVDPSFPPTSASIYGSEDPSTWRCTRCGFGENAVPAEANSREGVLRLLEDARRERQSEVRCGRCGRRQPALEVAMRPRSWARPGDLRDDLTMQTSTVPWEVFRGEPRADDVRQGGLGNCWMVCAISVLADVAPGTLRKCFEQSPRYNPAGAYRVRLNSGGSWHSVVVDDSLPATALETAAYLKPARRSLWAPLLEKAAAKLWGSYSALQGGSFAEAFSTLTGYPVSKIQLSKFVSDGGAAGKVFGRSRFAFADDAEAALELFATLYSFQSAGFAVGASTFVAADDDATEAELRSLGLQTRHAYGVLEARQDGEELLVKLRNPNGVALWTGPMSRSRLDAAKRRELGLDDDDRGVFWMRCADLARYFVELTVCRVVPDHYLEVRAGGWLASRFGAGDAARLDVYERASVELALYQEPHAQRGETAARAAVDLGLALVKLGHDHEVELVASARRVAHSAGAACDASLEHDASPTTYLVLPLCFGHLDSTEPRKFTLAAHASRHALTLDAVKLDAAVLARAVLALALDSGERSVVLTRADTDAFAVYVLHDEAGLSVVAENSSPAPLLAQLDADRADGLLSTRGALATQDVLPPYSRMILAVFTKDAAATRLRLDRLSYSASPLPPDYAPHPDTDHVPALRHLADDLAPFHRPVPMSARDPRRPSPAGGPGPAGGGPPAALDPAALASALHRALPPRRNPN